LFSNIDNPIVRSGQWQKFATGSSNKIYSACVAKQIYVLRINASTDYAFGVSREREAKVLALIQGQSWAPTIIENNLDQGWCLMLHQGSNYTESENAKNQILTMLRKMQLFSSQLDNAIIKSIDFDYLGLFNSYIKKLSVGQGNDLVLQLCSLLHCSLEKLPAVGRALVHQDLHPKNVCCNARIASGCTTLVENTGLDTGQLVAIDWEYAGWGNPWLDIAAVHQAFVIDGESLHRLPLFSGMSARQFNAGLDHGVAINNALACIWYWLRSELPVKNAIEQAEQQILGNRSQLQRQAEQCIRALR